MRDFVYAQAVSVAGALSLIVDKPSAKYLAGGTNLVDLMRENIETPAALVDVRGLSAAIEDIEGGGLRIGGAVTNTALALDRRVRERYPVLSAAILSGASGQIRNLATVAGNLLQRTRCSYFYDHAARCNKREPGQGCDALEGYNRGHAVLGASRACIAVFPSDMCVALSALDASIVVEGPGGRRSIQFVDFHCLPGDTPHIDNSLGREELITAVEIPPRSEASNSAYRKIRDRASYAFALVSVAAALVVRDEAVQFIRLSLGGVAHKPWRATRAEAALIGKPATVESFQWAADAEMSHAHGYGYNDFKIKLAKTAIVETLGQLARKGDTK